MSIREKLFATLMLSVALVILTFIVVVPIPSNAETQQHCEIYPLCGVVCGFNYAEDVVYIVDPSGEIWSFEGIEDWAIRDIVAMLMHDMGTEIIYDDVIVSVRYCGYI